MRTPTFRRVIGAGLGAVLLGASVVAMAGPAGAADDTGGAGPARHHPQLSAEQRQCLQDKGITRPVRPLTKEKVQQLKDAAQACNITLPRLRHPLARRLTAEQRQCLQDKGITRPVRPLTKEKVQQLKDAAQACNITLPHLRHRLAHRLTAEQRQCLQDKGITRPVRPLTPEKLQQLKDAAQACGIERPNPTAGATAST